MASEMGWSSQYEPLSELPSEILHHILSHLPISALALFAQTSKFNCTAATSALKSLHLSVLPRRIHGILAFLNTSTWGPDDKGYQCELELEDGITQINHPTATTELYHTKRSGTQPSPRVHRKQQIAAQNVAAEKILSSRLLSNLQNLTIQMYDLTSVDLANVLATNLPNLQNLHLNFNHPYIHDSCLPSTYFRVAPKGSPVWNTLAGIGSNSIPSLTSLRSLTIERAGLTSVQLQKWIESNPNLNHIKLKNVTGVDVEFVNWLGKTYSRSNVDSHKRRQDQWAFDTITPRRILKTLALENCTDLKLETEQDFASFLPSVLPDLTKLSFNSCHNVNSSALLQFVSNWQERNYLFQSSTLKRSSTKAFLDVDIAMDEELVVIAPDHRQRSRRVRSGHLRSRNHESSTTSAPLEPANLEISPSLSAVDILDTFSAMSSKAVPSFFANPPPFDLGLRLTGEISFGGSVSAPTSLPSTPMIEIGEDVAMRDVLSLASFTKRAA